MCIRDRFEELSKERESNIGVNTESLTSQIIDLSKQVESKNNFIAKIEIDYEKGDLSALLYSKHVEKINKEKEAIEIRIRKIKIALSKANVRVESSDKLKQVLETFLNRWDTYPNKSKKIIIRSFLPRIEVDKLNNVYIAVSLPVSLVNLALGKRSHNFNCTHLTRLPHTFLSSIEYLEYNFNSVQQSTLIS